jgi:hypothetical protein
MSREKGWWLGEGGKGCKRVMWWRAGREEESSVLQGPGGRSLYCPPSASRPVVGTQRGKGRLLCRRQSLPVQSAAPEKVRRGGCRASNGRYPGSRRTTGARLRFAQGIVISLHGTSGGISRLSDTVDAAALPCADEVLAAQIQAAEMDSGASVTCTGDGKCSPDPRPCTHIERGRDFTAGHVRDPSCPDFPMMTEPAPEPPGKGQKKPGSSMCRGPSCHIGGLGSSVGRDSCPSAPYCGPWTTVLYLPDSGHVRLSGCAYERDWSERESK